MYAPTQPEQDRPEQALEQSLATSLADGDHASALTLVASNWPRLACTQGAQLRAWIRQIPEHLWNEDARIIAALGASHRSVDSRSTQAALPHFELAELLIAAGVSDPADLPTIQVHHAAALRRLGRLDAAHAKAESASRLLRDELHLTLPLRLALQAEASLQLGLVNLHRGAMSTAVDQLGVASGLSDSGLEATDVIECLGALAYSAYCSGDFDDAERLISRARATAGDPAILQSAFGAPLLATETLLAVDRNEAADARAGSAALAAAAHGSDWEPLAYYARAATSAINGQLIEALDLQRHCTAAARGWEGAAAIRTLAELLRAGLHLQLGEVEHAARMLDAVGPLQDHEGCPASLRASIRFGAGDFAGCLDALSDCESLDDEHSSRTFIDVLLLAAAARYELGHLVAADVAFDRALYLGARTGIRVPFLVIPRITMLRMLNRAADRYQPDLVDRLLEELRVGSVTTGEMTEPLSDRELDIAQHLFQDKTVGQIAAELFISVNTVKTHVRSIYRKLSATNRREAIRRVHELGLDVKITPF